MIFVHMETVISLSVSYSYICRNYIVVKNDIMILINTPVAITILGTRLQKTNDSPYKDLKT